MDDLQFQNLVKQLASLSTEDEPPISRNEMLASFMRRLDICEQRGSGVDKAIFEIELYQLPPPDFRVTGQSVITTLYAPRKCAQYELSFIRNWGAVRCALGLSNPLYETVLPYLMAH